MAVTFMATLLFSGCQKDSVTLRIRINDFGGNGKVYMDSYNPHWSSSEAFRINGEDYQVNGISGNNISLSVPSSPSYSAFYPSQFYSSTDGNAIHFTLPRVQYYVVDGNNQLVKAPMAAFATTPSQTASNVPITFNNIGALLAINIDNNLLPNTATLTVDSVVVTTVGNTLPLWGDAVLPDITDPNSYYSCVIPSNATNPDKYYTVSVAKDNGNPLFTLTNGTSRKVYIFIPSAEALSTNKFKITVYAGANTKWQEQTSATGGLIRHGMMATVPFQMRNVVAPAGAVSGGQFTVGTNKRVWFSAGNLQWKPTTKMSNPGTGTWRFAPNQWDFVGADGWGTISESDNNSITDGEYTGWIDLFGWGTSGYDNPNDNNDIYHQPYDYVIESRSENSSKNYYGYGPSGTSNTSFPSLVGDPYSNYDWGVYNTITYNGATVSTSTIKWRTLTSEEWGWLLGINSTNTSNRRLSDGRRGVHVCFSPADYVTLDNNTIHGILVYDDDHLGSSLTDADNSTAKPVCCILRQTQTGTGIPDGCVFLPVTSYRYYNSANNGSYQINTGTGNLYKGFYWSTTVLSHKNAYYAELTNNADGGAGIGNTLRCYGLAVRLVTPVQ